MKTATKSQTTLSDVVKAIDSLNSSIDSIGYSPISVNFAADTFDMLGCCLDSIYQENKRMADALESIANSLNKETA